MRNHIDPNDLKKVLGMGYRPMAARACPIGSDGKINPHVTSFLLKDLNIVSVFHVKPIYYETTIGTWRPLGEVTTYHGNRIIHLKPDWARYVSTRYMLWLQKRQALIGGELLVDYGPLGAGLQLRHLAFATTLTAYPDPDPETTTVDGRVTYAPGLTTWASIRGQATGTSNNSTAGATDIILQAEFEGGFGYALQRGFYLFDTSAITAAGTVNSSTFSVYGETGGQTAESSNPCGFSLVSSSPATNTNLVNGDFSQVGTTKFSTDITQATWEGATQYRDFVLNASGLAAISKTAVTKLGSRSINDFSDATAPIDRTYRKGTWADNTGTTQDPKLVIDYTVPITTSVIMFAQFA